MCTYSDITKWTKFIYPQASSHTPIMIVFFMVTTSTLYIKASVYC